MVRKIVSLLLVCLVLANCSVQDAAGLTKYEGNITVQRLGSRKFSRIYTFQSIKIGEIVRSGDASSYAEMGFGYPRMVLLPNSQVSIQKYETSEQGDLWISATLDYGSVFVETPKPLGKGSFEVHTVNGVAALHGSSMVVTQDSQTTVNCLSGTVTLTGSSTVSLMAGQSSSLLSPGTVPTPPENKLYIYHSDDPSIEEVITDYYLHPGIEDRSTFTPEPTYTPTRLVSRTPTLRATWTPFALGPTSTQRVDAAVPTLRPTITLPVNFSGLTVEEQAARGSFSYAVACQSWGDCVCDSALAEPFVTIPAEFTDAQVTLGAGEEAFSYAKIWPNLYRVTLDQKVAEIRFLPEGFEFYMTQAGQACSLQTFTRQP